MSEDNVTVTEPADTSTPTDSVTVTEQVEQPVIHTNETVEQAAPVEDVTDYKAKYEATLAESRKHEGRAKAYKAQIDGKPAQATATETAEAPAVTEPEPETAKPDPLVIENLILRAAPKLGADADDLLDSRSLMADLEALDSTADDYADQVQAAIKAAVDARPNLAVKPARAGKSGNPVGGGATHVELDPRKLANPETSGPKVRIY